MKNLLAESPAKRLVDLFDTLIWIIFLVLQVAISFNNTLFSSNEWWWCAAIVYALLSLSLVSASFGGKANIPAIVNSKYLLLLLVLSLIWIVLSLFLPLANPASALIAQSSQALVDTPEWYQINRPWSFTPQKSFLLLLSEFTVFAFLILALLVLSSRQRVLQLLMVISLVGVVHALIGIGFKYSNLHLVDLKQLDGHYSAARAWFVNRNHYAAFLSLSLVGGLCLIFRSLFDFHQSELRSATVFAMRLVFALTTLLLILVAIILSESRAGFLSILLGLGFLLLVLNQRIKQGKKFWLSLLLIATFIVIALTFFGSNLLSRFSLDTGILGERIVQWQLTWQIIKQQWFFGYGANSYADVFQLFRTDEPLREVIYNQAHNDYLHIWLELGLFGLLLWILFLGRVIFTGIGILKTHGDLFFISTTVACLSVLSAALLQSLVDFNLQILNIRFYFFAIIAVVLVLPTISQSCSNEQCFASE